MLKNKAKFDLWLPALFDGQFHWDFLKPAFYGTKVMPMDFDAVIERYSSCLIFETKDNGKNISLGQSLTLTNQWKRPDTTIIHVQGKSQQDITGCAIYSDYEPGKQVGDYEMTKVNAFDLIYITQRWFCMASNWQCPTREEWDRQLWLWDYDRTTKKQGDNYVR